VQNFVQYGNAGAVVNGNTLNVTQSTATAILNWADFNIANGYTVNFAQPSTTSSVLNKIWSADPSVIAGALKANGQVYLYNQNGIVFDKGAQVNVGSLIASTLALGAVNGSTDPDALYKNGLLSNTPETNQPAFAACTGSACAAAPGGVTVNAGATLAAADGGRIMLIGSAVTNNGTISTPDGQTLLAAGNKVFLAASTDPALRGLLIEVSTGGAAGAAVTNNGTVSADRGNITLAGMVVNQAGQLSATTSVSANGSIFLVAGDATDTSFNAVTAAAQGFGHLLPVQGGTVTLAPGSVTQVLPDAQDTGTISEQNLASAGGFQPSQVGVVGQTVAMVGNASVHAPGGKVTLSASADPKDQFQNTLQGTATNDGGRIYLDSGSSIDVSGLQNVPVPVSQNILKITLEGVDLADDPQLRDTFLHGQPIVVNANQGSPLFDVTPYKNNISVGIKQVLTAGGSISLDSGGDVIARAGSTMNVSGGSIAYQGGMAASTTKLVTANGQVYDIGNAPANLNYVGIANSFSYVDPTWGTQTNLTSQSYYQGYLQGGSAGGIRVLGPQMYLGGSMLGTTVSGPYQRQPAALPLGGQLLIGCNCSNGTGVDLRAPAIVFTDDTPASLPANFTYVDPNSTLPVGLQEVTELSPAALTQSGFDRLTIFSNGAVTLPRGVDMSLAPGGSLSVTSDQLIDVAGTIRAPGGTVALATMARSSGQSTNITLDAGAVIDVSGTWVNDSPLVNGSALGTAPLSITGGKISFSAEGDVILGDHSRLDVSGGGSVSNSNAITKGNAGSIDIAASLRLAAATKTPFTGKVRIGDDVALVGNSLAAGGGGSLSISSGSVTLGWQPTGSAGELLLRPDFFRNLGFKSYNITGQNGLVVGSQDSSPPAVTINPIQENLVFTGNPLLVHTGTDLSSFTQLQTLSPTQRAPASITLATTATSLVGTNAPDAGNLFVASNASIVTDPGATVTLTSSSQTGSITFLGSIIAPSGTVSLALTGAADVFGYVPNQQILLGPTASIQATGIAQVDTLNLHLYREGSVLSGGTVNLAAHRGYVVTDPGSTIDVSGAATQLDIVNSQGVTPTVVASNAGSINIDAREGLLLQGALRGEAAQYDGAPVAGAGGGTLSIGLDLFDYVATAKLVHDGGFTASPYSLAARTLTLTDGPSAQFPTSGVAMLSEQSLMSGGFDNLTLNSADVISVDGNVALSTRASIVLDAPLLRAQGGAALHLSSAHVSLGNYNNQRHYYDTVSSLTGNGDQPAITPSDPPLNPTANAVLASSAKCYAQCTGTLSVDAQLIDIRGVSGFAGFSSESLSSSGDIRFSAANDIFLTTPTLPFVAGDTSTAALRSGLFASGTLNLTAQQAYPTTHTDFTIAAGSAVNIVAAQGSAAAAPPLSAGGILTINAPTINQSGVLRAPMGEITLNGTTVALEAGSITSVSADGMTIPYGSTQNGQQWTYSPESGFTEILSAPPAKTVNLNGDSVFVQKGATIDVSGGGDLLASEWIAGPGGSTDILNPNSAANHALIKPYQYAIVPSLGTQFGPLDAQFNQQAVSSNRMIYLSGVPGLPAGYYALLPARYALLPGAFAVSVVQTNSDLVVGSAARQTSGAYIVGARLGTAGTDILDSRTSTVLVAPSSVVQSQSQYTQSYANTFFSSAAAAAQTATPALPADAGALNFSVTTSLALNGTINFTPGSYSIPNSSGPPTVVHGAGGNVSIQAPVIAVTDSATALASLPEGALALDAQTLNGLGATTIILGGTAHQTSAGEEITVGTTQTVELANTTQALTAPEIILAAQNNIAVDAGAEVSAKGTLNQSPTKLVVNGAGALLRASSGALAAVELELSDATGALPQNAAGTLSVGSAASLAATGSLLLYASGNTTASSDVVLSTPALGVYSSRVSLGDVPSGADAPNGLNLTSQLLGTLASATNLTLGSTSTIDFYGAVNLGGGSLQSLTLNAAALDGYDTAGSKANVAIQAGSILFENSTGATLAYNQGTAPTGTGSLSLTATATGSTQTGQLILGAGAKTISGFDGGVALAAAADIQTQGKGSSLAVRSSGVNAATTPVSLSMTSAALTAGAGSDETISATGPVTIAQGSAGAKVPTAPLGGKLAIESGAGIQQNGTINLPGGIIELHAANGDVVLGSASITSAAGAVQSFTVTNAVAPAGQISLTSDKGSVTLASGATVDVSGATSSDGKVSGDAGSLTVSAPTGTFAFAGSVLKGAAAAGQMQGNFTLDVGQGLAGSGFATLADTLHGGGFTGALDLRSREDTNIVIANTTNIAASSFTLTADQGSIDVQGQINTSGGTASSSGGGAISLWAQNDLTLESTARLIADASGPGPKGVNGVPLATRGGNVTLGTQSGKLVLNGGKISMLGSNAAAGSTTLDGTLTLRAPRTADQMGVNIQTPAAGTVEVDTHNPIVVEGVQCYGACTVADRANPPSSITLGDPTQGALDITLTGGAGTLFGDAQIFAGNGAVLAADLAKGFSNTLGASAAPQVQVRPGIEVDSTGDITVAGLAISAKAVAWDLDSWNAALGVPVNVNLRAAGNLVFNASLSDGFTIRGTRAVQQWTFGGSGANHDSADYRLAASADLTSANPLAVAGQPYVAETSDGTVSGTGHLVVAPGQLVRTGDGNIQIAAGGDVLIGYAKDPSSGAFTTSGLLANGTGIYTAGVPSVLTDDQATVFTAPANNANVVAYPTGGGDVSITAANDIRSAPSARVPSDWIWRQGIVGKDGSIQTNTSWWVEVGNFQGIGALGGGDVALAAGRDVVDVTAAITSTGRLLGAVGTQPELSNLLLTGGGSLAVHAKGNISGGVFEDDWGNASLVAGGALNGGATVSQLLPDIDPVALTQTIGSDATTTAVNPLLFVGSGAFTADSRAGASIDFVGNSTAISESSANVAASSQFPTGFFTYSAASALTIESTTGNVVLRTDANTFPAALESQQGGSFPKVYNNPPEYVYPPTLNVAALAGNIEIVPTKGDASALQLFPAAGGNLNLLAQGSVTGSATNDPNAHFAISMFESDPSLWSSVLSPLDQVVVPSGPQLPVTILHQADTSPVNIVAETGDISGGTITLPKSANIVAGGDIRNLNLVAKNLNPSDVTLVEAGGNITWDTPTAPLTNALQVNNNGIVVGGPGFAEVLAGGSLDLGNGNGILTSGSFNDPRLPSTSASIIAGAGFGSASGSAIRLPAASAFINAYLAPDKSGKPSAYANQLVAYMQQLEPQAAGSTTYAAALAAFEKLTFQQQLPLLSQVLMTELSNAGIDYNKTHSFSSYVPGYNAINTLFPNKDAAGNALAYKGDIDLFFSQIKTEQGGNINLLAPGGSVVVGVPNPPASLSKVKGSTNAPIVTPASQLGLLVLASGVIQGFANDSFEVNQSRILTLQGGDIILWASNGDIDAGKGAKSASGASPPIIQTDQFGNLFVNPVGDVAGSGIGQLLTGPGQTAGLVNLIAPRGTVNAGDAGIRVAGNLNIAAVQVIGASNITVGGTATGVPVSEAGALSGVLSGANSLGDAAKNTVDQLSQNLGAAASYQQLTESLTPTFIVVKMFCLGLDCQLH